MTTPATETVSPISQWYDMMTRMFPDQRLTFLNYGYLAQDSDFDWINDADLEQKCSVNLIRTLLGDSDLRGKKVLEIGSGRGGNCSYLARYTGAASVTGLDFCPAHIELCNRVHALPGLSFVGGDAMALPFADNEFDVVINIESSHCYPDLNTFGAEVQRVLKQDGRFFYADTMKGDNTSALSEPDSIGVDFFSNVLAQHQAMIEHARFKVEEHRDISDGVIRAFESQDGHLKHLLRSLVEEKKQQREPLPPEVWHAFDTMFHFFDDSGIKAYKNGHLAYKFWRLQKAA
ncbi:SAM-dependent methyltransferase [Pseudomonas protegens]|uniref:S-adenosylmethionine-dependent methyltransferase n=2 Tax=Pseudomonas protegens TaxID=380021 RepID=Q4KCD2_PSEF5|nr:class I SAM-dependent methyltransferase [Pseudomonas protegens]AAY92267.1 S-adenosylmethionine-dependent methyltransferase [Pseudomonas protegens Pf-5]ASE23515.1 SAM-dependent methyltransferase [Pseudomonas protegens]QEZ52816.1 SAM-dependent methyltransferase [Pseudomonas protegens]QEZ60978.1 SAM-dependent methyltransferase [Pseudomonas protegens]QEZ64088.1 SAM-dependent methyltransferase [Pseudomonas protegens]